MQVRAGLPPGVDGWAVSLNGLMGMVVIGGFLILGIYWALQRKVVPKVNEQIGDKKKKKKTKAKMSVGESFAFLAASPYIRDLALLVRALCCIHLCYHPILRTPEFHNSSQSRNSKIVHAHHPLIHVSLTKLVVLGCLTLLRVTSMRGMMSWRTNCCCARHHLCSVP